MKIKAISLWQPWASLIAVGAKKYETRSWATSYRGPLLICAALRRPTFGELKDLWETKGFSKLAQPFLVLPNTKHEISLSAWCFDIPYGQALAIVDLTKITRTENCFPKQMKGALPFGDFSPGRYAWKLENVRLVEPFTVKGRQRLFEVELPENLRHQGGK